MRPQRCQIARVELHPLLGVDDVVVEPRAQLVVPHDGLDGRLHGRRVQSLQTLHVALINSCTVRSTLYDI